MPADKPTELTAAVIESAFEVAYTFACKEIGQPLILEGIDAWDGLTPEQRQGFRVAMIALAKELDWPISPALASVNPE